MKKGIIVLSVIALIWSCGDKETSTTNNPNNNNNVAVCDTLIPTFDAQIGNILNANCFPCHIQSSDAGINLSNYNSAKAAAQQAVFLKAIKHEAGAVAMPQSQPKLGDKTIQYIECWIENGFPQN